MDFAVSKGATATVLAERAAIDPSVLEDHDNRVPFESYIALMRAAKDLCNDPALPLHFGEAMDLSAFSIIGMLTRASETMMEALAQLNRYGQIVVEVDIGSAGRFAMEQRDGGVWLVDTRKDPNVYPELTESTFARMICGPRQFLPRANVHEVHVTHAAPAHRAAYERIFQCPVVFESDRNALLMDPELLHYRVAQEPRFVFAPLSAHAEALLTNLRGSKTARGRVESLLLPILHTGNVGMEAIAAKLEVSRRTLHRMLQAEGVTFERVLDDLRRKMALDYLTGKNVSVNETAYLVGFSEPAAFSRAFKRWTGHSPRTAKRP